MTAKLDLKNKIINGSFDFWQRGTSFASATNTQYTADRWAYGKVGSAVHTISRSSDIPATGFSLSSLLMTCTTAQASMGASDQFGIQQRIEGSVLRTFKDKKMVMSFWVKASKIGQYSVSFFNALGTRGNAISYTITSANTWEKKTIRVTFDSTGTWNYDSSLGMYVWFPIAVGSSLQGPTGWSNTVAVAVSGQVNLCDTVGATFQLADIVFVEDNDGQTRNPNFTFAGRDYMEEYQLCMRYFEKSTDIGTLVNAGAPTGGRQHGSTNTFTSATYQTSNVEFLVVKRVAPTVQTYDGAGSPNAFSLLSAGGLVSSGNGLTPQSKNAGEKGFYVYMAPNSQTLPYFYWSADAEL
jgi:hypothetical protein